MKRVSSLMLAIAVTASACTDAEEMYQSGFAAGFAAGHRVACENSLLIGVGDMRDSDYAAGFQAGYADGSSQCEEATQ